MNNNNIIEIKDLQKWFTLRGKFLDVLIKKKYYVKAVDEISFKIKHGEILGLVGESGCGKSTTARLILKLISPTGGNIYFNGRDIYSLNKKELKKFRKEAQIIFQDPYGSLNPRMKVFNIIGENIDIHGLAKNKKEKKDMIIKYMENVDLIPIDDIINKYPYELSGGQMQRVAIARALVLNPKFIISDEIVSMLDASIKANILNLLISINKKFQLSQLFITHDLAVAEYICNRIIVMYMGKIVEIGPTDKIVSCPLHPYTKALFSLVPVPDPKVKMFGKMTQKEINKILDVSHEHMGEKVPLGCSFYPRCTFALDVCSHIEPELKEIEDRHFVACTRV